MIEIERTIDVAASTSEVIDLVLDIERYATLDDKISPVLWSVRETDVVTFACRPKLAGIRQPKVVQTIRQVSLSRLEIALAPSPANRIARRLAAFHASFDCDEKDGRTTVRRSLRFDLSPLAAPLLEPLMRRRLPAEVECELDRLRLHFAH